MNEKKKKRWPWVLLGILIGFVLAFLLLFWLADDEDDYYYDGSYGDQTESRGNINGGGPDYYDQDYDDDYYGPGDGPDFGGPDSWDDYDYGDDYGDYQDSHDSYDSWFDGGESSYSYGDYTYTSSSGIFDEDDYPIGLATKLEGNVILYSMFVNYDNTVWDFSSSSDAENEAYVERELALAADYLESEAADYGKSLNIIYDWGQDPDLCSTITVSGDLVDDYTDYYAILYNYIDEYLASTVKSLEEKYDSDSLVFMAYLNTPNSLQQTSCTYPKWIGQGGGGMYEICFIHTRSYNEYESAAGYAHEICHAFGAPDLYTADEDGSNFGITQEYVDYNESTQSNDLMYTTYNAQTYATEYDHVSNEITDITAYYIGWTDSSETVEKWGFDPAEEK